MDGRRHAPFSRPRVGLLLCQSEIKALRHAANVFLDTSGSVVDEGLVEMAIRVAGVERVLFGCDNSLTAGMGKMRGAELSPADKQQVLGGNMQRLLQTRLNRK